MMDIWYSIIELLPFEWSGYRFMANALLAVILIAPVFGILGTMTVSNKLAFFSESLGHSALTGIAIGAVIGVKNPMWIMAVFLLIFSIGIVLVKNIYRGSTDTVIGVFSSMAVALGIVILSRGGGFSKYTAYLVGDILAISPDEVLMLFILLTAVVVIWIFLFNKLLVSSVNITLAKSRGVKTLATELVFTSMIAVTVAVTIQWVGLLIITSLLVIPAAAARNISGNVRVYHLATVIITLFSGMTGLITSYYWDTASGATIVLVASAIFLITLALRQKNSV